MIVGIDVGSETHYARAFDWRNYEFSKKPLEFGSTEAGFRTFRAWMEGIAEKHGKTAIIPGMEPTGHCWFAIGKFLLNDLDVYVSRLEELLRMLEKKLREIPYMEKLPGIRGIGPVTVSLRKFCANMVSDLKRNNFWR